jgi:putative Holliday junction resolvase
MRLLGLDLGTKTMGIAITDSLQLTVRGLENFLYANEDITKPINKIKEYIATYKDIEKIILGYPLKMNGEKSQFTLYVENFKKELEKCIDTKVELYDERLSTKMSFD